MLNYCVILIGSLIRNLPQGVIGDFIVKFFWKKEKCKDWVEACKKKVKALGMNPKDSKWMWKLKNRNKAEADSSENLHDGFVALQDNSLKARMERIGDRFSLLFFIASALLINFIIEAVSRHSFVKAFEYLSQSKVVFLYNSFLIFVTLTLSYLVRKRLFASMIIGGIWLIGGIANGAVLSYRTTPFTGTDMKLIKSAADLMTKYMSMDQMILTAIGAALVVIAFVIMAVRGPKYRGRMRYRRNIILIVLMFSSIIPVTRLCVETRTISTYFGNIAIAYEDYGFPYCFWSTVIAKGISCPNEYGESEIKAILEKDGEDSYNEESTPNIIIVQLESFFDPALVKGLEFSEDPLPNFRNLEKNYSSGYITVPSVGAGTANTEFEVISGMSLRYFGPGEYPYKTVLKENVCESVAYNLKDIGYSTHAIHNNEASFYSRRTVFSRLGFDTFTSEEMLDITGYTPLGWAEDEVLTSAITDCLKSTENKDFVYTISVQSHGGYPSEQILSDPKIKINGLTDEAATNAMEYYVNQLNAVDQFIGNLVEELSNYEEDTILVLFGDHLPSLGLEARNLSNRSLYQTEYVIWDNMGLKAKDENLKSYQLAAKALDKADIHVGTLMKFHQKRSGTDKYWVDLEALQYDMLYGKKYMYDGESPYERLKLTMGVKDVTISSVTTDIQGNVIISGDTFNASSSLAVNGKQVEETKFIDKNTLMVAGVQLNTGDVLSVNQVSSGGRVLREGSIYTY